VNVLAGFVRFDRASAIDGACEAILDAQAPAGTCRSLGSAEFGIANPPSLSSSADIQPLLGAQGRLLFVGDVRLDNREDLAAELELARSTGDAEVALAAWERWAEAALDRLRGEYALAVWSDEHRRLTLARGPLSTRQIFYRHEPNGVVFATIPQALFMGGAPSSLDFDSAARFVGGVASPSERTFFGGILRLHHATVARFTVESTKMTRFWEPKRRMEHMGEAEAAERMAELLDRAVKARLRGRRGLVASHLSSGRDSGAVATSAAIALHANDEPLLCYTAAPRSGFAGSGLPGRMDDESSLAAATARLYPNIRHAIIRPGRDAFADVEPAHRLLAGPIGTLSNFQWARDIELAAREAGAGVMLNATLGNLSISAGDEWHLLEVLREEGVLSWWRAARMFVGSGADFLRLANWTVGGTLPHSLHRAALRIAGRSAGNRAGLPLLREPYRAAVRAAVAIQTDVRPPSDAFAYRGDLLLEQDPGDTLSLISGMDVLDPTADRDLIEFCFNIPARLLIGPPGTRPLCDRAFGPRLGWQAGEVRPRGYQGADWYLSFTRKRIEEALEAPRRHDLVRELIDLDYVDRMLASWPAEWSDVARMLHYRNDLLRAVSAANYIAVNF
jgi:asparagine synthase (glutamine-hydrolysing)